MLGCVSACNFDPLMSGVHVDLSAATVKRDFDNPGDLRSGVVEIGERQCADVAKATSGDRNLSDGRG
jgi:hypothetical protein